MSSPRFASITSALLATKGEARPWRALEGVFEGPSVANRVPPGGAPDDVALSPLPPPMVRSADAPGVALHRCTIRISAHDFQRLGIVAVKDGTTRQHLLQQALADLLAAKERQYRRACRCMASAPCGACDTP